YRDQVIARAQGETQRFTKLLGEYKNAKDVTRDRLYIDAMQSVLSNSSKVLVDVQGGNNMLYLPLDRLLQQSSSAQVPADSGNAAESIGRGATDRGAQSRTSR